MISKEDWDNIEAEVAKMAQSQQGGAPGALPGAPPGGALPGPQAGGGPMPAVAMIVQALQQMPPPVLQAIGNALAQGIPPAQIFQQMMRSGGGAAG
jgi:hypothetical protein